MGNTINRLTSFDRNNMVDNKLKIKFPSTEGALPTRYIIQTARVYQNGIKKDLDIRNTSKQVVALSPALYARDYELYNDGTIHIHFSIKYNTRRTSEGAYYLPLPMRLDLNKPIYTVWGHIYDENDSTARRDYFRGTRLPLLELDNKQYTYTRVLTDWDITSTGLIIGTIEGVDNG